MRLEKGMKDMKLDKQKDVEKTGPLRRTRTNSKKVV